MKKRKQQETRQNVGSKSFLQQLKKFWHFVWNDNSLASWAVSIVLAFIIIRFIFYPVLGLVMGTNLPVVAVISSSMEHNGEDWTQNPAYCYSEVYCIQEEWYLAKGITPLEFKEFPFQRGFNKGDIMIIVGKKPEKIDVGDVVVFEAGKNYPIIHRVVSIHNNDSNIVFETKGDNNPTQITTLDLNEKNIAPQKIRGVAKARIPYLGYIKIAAAKIIFSIRGVIAG
ncbi:MAG: signal peptidase I [Candidatus Nanoarchaeia archaeon]